MAINKDFLVKNGLQVGGNTQLTGSLTAAGLSYPVSDGDPYMAMVTDGNGNLSFNNVDTVESDVTNQTGSLIPKGTPVYQTGAAGNTLTIAPSDASNAATMPAIGVAASDIADGDTGRVIHFGYIKGVDTSAFSEGDRIYVADGGGYQEGRPTGEGNVVQFLGVVTKVHATNGSGVVFGGGRAHAVPNLDDGNIFIGDNTNSPVTATLDTSIVPENSNLYFTDARAKTAIESSTHLTIDGGTLYIDTDNNYIGINDTSPQQALDVTGAIAIGGTTVIDSGGEVVTAQLKDSGVTANTYGSASLVPIITVDSKGRITSASTTSVAGVSNFTFNNTTDVLTISTADGGSYTSDISNITVGGSMDGPLANLTVKYQSTAPTSPSQGQIYFDSLNQLLMIYTGSSWVQTIPSSSGGGSSSGTTDAVATFQKYTYTLSSTTNAVSGASEQVVDAGDFTIGKSYQIRSAGDTDFTAIGAADNNVGTVFVATGVGEGTGSAWTYLAYSTAGAQNVEVFVNGTKQVEGATNDYVATTGTAVTFTYNIPAGSVIDVQIYELLTQDAFYLKSETYTTTEVNSQISTAISAYLPLTGGTLTGALTGTSATLTGGLTVDTSTLVVDNVNNRVGIGATSPIAQLDVRGAGNIFLSGTTGNGTISATGSGTSTLTLQSNAGTYFTTNNNGITSTSTADNHFRAVNGSNEYRFGVDAAGIAKISHTGVADRLSISSTGRFGFNTLTPQQVYTTDTALTLAMPGITNQWGVGPTASYGNFYIANNGYGIVITGNGTQLGVTHSNTTDLGSTAGKFKDLYLAGNASIDGTANIAGGVNVASSTILLNSNGTIKYGNNGASIGTLSYGGTGLITLEATSANTTTRIQASGTGQVQLAAGGAIRATADDNGDFMVAKTTMGVSNVGFGIYASGAAEINAGNAVALYLNRTTGDGTIVQFRKDNGTKGSIDVSTTGTTYNTTSDRRLKENIVAITNGKEKLLAMKPVTHTWIADPDAPAVHGFIAQEMQEVVPEAVSGEDGDEQMMTMDYGRITPVIVAALQDALKEIEKLKERINTLEAK